MFSPEPFAISARRWKPELLKLTNSGLPTGKKDLPNPSKYKASMIEVLPLPFAPWIKFFAALKVMLNFFKFLKPLICKFLTTKSALNIQGHNDVKKMGPAAFQRLK